MSSLPLVSRTTAGILRDIFFVFLRSHYHRVLHSFPTRRSSDLNPTYQAGLRRDAVQPDIEAERKKRDEIEAERRRVDRKSGSAGMPRPISYAVFCLKKKMIICSGTSLLSALFLTPCLPRLPTCP